jgi:hypothetical protein
MICLRYISNNVAPHRSISPILIISRHFHKTNFPLWIWTQHLIFFLEFLACTSANTIYVGQPIFLIIRIVIRLYHTVHFFNHTLDTIILYIPVVRLTKQPASTYASLIYLWTWDSRGLLLSSSSLWEWLAQPQKKVEYQYRRSWMNQHFDSILHSFVYLFICYKMFALKGVHLRPAKRYP